MSKTALLMLISQSKLFIDPNLKAGVEEADTLNQKRIRRVIDKLQECSLRRNVHTSVQRLSFRLMFR